MRSPVTRLAQRAVLLPLLGLWPLLQAQAQTPPSAPPAAPALDCEPPAPPHPPQPPQLTPELRERHLQQALSLSAEQARQLDALLSQAHDQHQPPDEAALARLLSAEQRKRLHELRPPPPPPPQPVPAHRVGDGCARPMHRAAPPQKGDAPAPAASRPAA